MSVNTENIELDTPGEVAVTPCCLCRNDLHQELLDSLAVYIVVGGGSVRYSYMVLTAAVFASSLAVQMVQAIVVVVVVVVSTFAAAAAAVVAFVVIAALQVVCVLHVAVAITVAAVAMTVVVVAAAAVANHNYWKYSKTCSSYSSHCCLYYNNTGFVSVAASMHYYTMLADTYYVACLCG